MQNFFQAMYISGQFQKNMQKKSLEKSGKNYKFLAKLFEVRQLKRAHSYLSCARIPHEEANIEQQAA